MYSSINRLALPGKTPKGNVALEYALGLAWALRGAALRDRLTGSGRERPSSRLCRALRCTCTCRILSNDLFHAVRLLRRERSPPVRQGRHKPAFPIPERREHVQPRENSRAGVAVVTPVSAAPPQHHASPVPAPRHVQSAQHAPLPKLPMPVPARPRTEARGARTPAKRHRGKKAAGMRAR